MAEDRGAERDWSGFVQRIYVAASPAEAWTALSTPTGLVSWFTPQSEMWEVSGRPLAPDRVPSVGCRYHWEWAEGSCEDGSVLDLDPGRRIRFTWYGGKGWVEFRCLENGGRTMVELEERILEGDLAFLQDVYLGCSQGWAFFLTNLRSVLDGGLDLRERHPDLPGLVNA